MSDIDTISQEVPSTGLEKFLEDNFRKILWLCVIVVIALAAYAYVQHQNTLKSNQADEEYTSAKTVEDCDLVISHHPGTNAAANALLLKAKLQWDKNNKSSAVESLKAFGAKHAEHPLAVNALLSLGTKLESMGERKEAQAIFERITREFPASEAAPLAQIHLGDLLWADGKADEAKKTYEDLAMKFPDMGDFQSVSQNRLGWIAAALPTKEVDAPPPPPKAEPKPGEAAAVPGAGMPKINLTPGGGGLGATIAPPGSVPVTPSAAPAMMQPPAMLNPPPTATTPPVSLPQPTAPTPAPASTAPATTPAAPPASAPTPAPTPPATTPATPPAPAPATPPPSPAPVPTAPAPSTPPVTPPSN